MTIGELISVLETDDHSCRKDRKDRYNVALIIRGHGNVKDAEVSNLCVGNGYMFITAGFKEERNAEGKTVRSSRSSEGA